MNNWIFYLILFISVFIAACSQILLKKSAQKKHPNKLREYLNPLVIGAYCLFGFTAILTIIAYQGVPWAHGPVIETTGYIHIAILGFLFLKEQITMRKALGTALIIAGIIVFTLF